MAKPHTYKIAKGGYFSEKDGCAICGSKPEYRAFYYPTYMNGDAEWLGDYCALHKHTDLIKVQDGKIPLLYKVEGVTNTGIEKTTEEIEKEAWKEIWGISTLISALNFYKETFPAQVDVCIKIEELLIELNKIK